MPIPPDFDWFPDSRQLLVGYLHQLDTPAGLFRLSLATGKRERITEAPPTFLADRSPTVSADGRRVAFIRGPSLNNSRVYILDLSASGQPDGPPREIARNVPARRPVFTADGREIIFTGSVDGVDRLYRISVAGNEPPVPLNTIGGRPSDAAISRHGNRLAYSAGDVDTDIWKLELGGTGGRPTASSFIASSRLDRSPAYSPDGLRVAFSSWRSGYQEIFVADANGRNPKQLTFLEAGSGVPNWSPDGGTLVFNSNTAGTYHIYSIGSNGGTPVLLTPGDASDGQPSFSRDGKYIYFVSNRTGTSEIWKLPTGGGAPVQITRTGGIMPIESFDGKMLYYCGVQGLSLKEVPSGGGKETTVVDAIAQRSFSVARQGIYYYLRGHSAGFYYLDLKSRKARRIADGDDSFQYGLSASPDERSLLFVTRKPGGADLMLIENFR